MLEGAAFVKVLIADDNIDSIEILEYFISQVPGFDVIGSCRDGEELIQQVIVQSPELILVDINMLSMSGLEAVKECLKIKPDLRFIFITGYDQFAVEAFELSALDYIIKPIENQRLYVALERAKKRLLNKKKTTQLNQEQSDYLLNLTDLLTIYQLTRLFLLKNQERNV